ncbi:aspartyl protease family protein [Microbacterium protaetiae]|uniref:aspartyl protease family protein n=1 Tax=Microbacterium protaetiae TaxID=2509458 RepID=UPI0013EA1E15|nr:aspartyl protease family protein [Microbacterium protaetiae]
MASVPLSIRVGDDPGSALLFVTASVGGVAEEFLLDTGASRSSIRRSERTDAWAVDAADPGSHGVFGAAAHTRHARVPTITLGTIEIHDLVVDVSDDDAPAGILGLDVLRGHRVGVRLSAQVLQLDEQAAIDRWRPLTMSSRGHSLVEVEWEDAAALAIWDTGASTTVVDADLAAAHPRVFAPTGATGTGTDAYGHQGETAELRMAPAHIGERRFSATTAATAPLAGLARAGDPPFTMIIGYPLIAQADWVFDLRARMWGFLDRS